MINILSRKLRAALPFWRRKGNHPTQFFPEVETYVKEFLQPKLGLSDIFPYSGHYQNGLAHTKEGKMFINFFSRQHTNGFHRSLYTHALLEKHEINVPELLWADTDPHNLQKYHVCCFATRWISGKSIVECPQESTLEAFKLMGKIHTITLEQIQKSHQDFSKTCPLPILSGQALAEKLRSTLNSPLTKDVVSLDDASQAFSFLESGLTSAFSSLNSPVLLHRDFHSGNLLQRPDESLVILDFETSAFGPFFIDLSKSLIMFCHKSQSKDLDNIDLDELLQSSELQILSQAYFTVAPPSAKETWESFGSFFLFWAYLKIICQITRKTSVSSQNNPTIEQTKIQLTKRWNSIVKYMQQHPKIGASFFCR